MKAIKFGTDGWRAITGEDFTPENITQVIQAFADLNPDLKNSDEAVIIGYDRRDGSPEAADLIAEVLLGNGIKTVLAETFCPTPTVSWYTKTNGCRAGIMVTASHNPPKWNGIKFKESYGGAASGDYCKPIEEKIVENVNAGNSPKKASLEGNELLSTFNPFAEYLKSISDFFDLEMIKKSGFKVMVDPLFGSGSGYYPALLGDMITEIHNEADTSFGGLNPEPIPPNANELMERVGAGNFNCGLLTDGDADRAGAVDENGNFVTTHELYALIIRHAVENKKWTGKIIKSISTTRMIDKLGKKYNLPVDTTPVGFKYISPAMKEPGVLVGGEESGGFGFPRHVAERDGLFSGMMILEYMAVMGKTLGELVTDLQREFGPTKYRRNDLHLSDDEIARARDAMDRLDIKAIDEKKVIRHETMDGHHFLFDDDSWLLFRASGTEPLIRVYAEARTTDEVEKMLTYGKKAIGV